MGSHRLRAAACRHRDLSFALIQRLELQRAALESCDRHCRKLDTVDLRCKVDDPSANRFLHILDFAHRILCRLDGSWVFACPVFRHDSKGTDHAQRRIGRTDSRLGKISGPIPKERRTLKQRFDAVSVEGERLHILEPRWALDDQHFTKSNGKVQKIDRQEFFTPGTDLVAGVELDSVRHTFLLSQAGARMLKRDEDSMIYAVEFKPERFESEQLMHLRFLPNIEQIQLSGTDIQDEDLRWLVDLPKLTAVGLNDTAITDRGIEILSRSKSVVSIQIDQTVDETNVSERGE